MKSRLLAGLTAIVFSISAQADVVKVFWSNGWTAGPLAGPPGTVNSVNPDGTDSQVLATLDASAGPLFRVTDVEIDPARGALYFTNWDSGSINSSANEAIYRTGLNGSGQILFSNNNNAGSGFASGLHRLAIDPANGDVYFTRAVSYAGSELSRVDSAGGSHTVLEPGAQFYSGVALDNGASLVYFGNGGVGATNAVNVIAKAGGPSTALVPAVPADGLGKALAFDGNYGASGTVFYGGWAIDASAPPPSTFSGPANGGGQIWAYDVATATPTLIVNDPTTGIPDIEVDPVTQRIWWTDYVRGQIRSANYNGTNVVREVIGLANPFGLDLLLTRELEGAARFHVTKTFSDGSDDEVDVAINCNDGLPSSDSAMVTGGDPAGHTFVVEAFADGEMDCTITESGGPDGYTSSPADGCVFENISSINSPFECAFGNEALPGEYTVTKEWVINNEGGDFIREDVRVTIACDREIFNKGAEQIQGTWFLSRRLGDGESMTASVRTERRPNRCMAEESINQSGVESESEGSCDWHEIGAGESSYCTFINTVFFEGIPTLSQYGLALLALLMLGVGMVGFRRFV